MGNKMKVAFSNLINILQSVNKDKHLSEYQLMQMVKPHVKDLLAHPTWIEERFYEVDQVSGFNGYKIYEEPDHSMSVFITSWLPARGSPVHNHGTWAITAGVIGIEHHTFWHMAADDQSRNEGALIIKEEKKCCPGDVICLDSSVIHSVNNPGNAIAISLQVYGKHPNHTNRVQFNVNTGEKESFQGKEIHVA